MNNETRIKACSKQIVNTIRIPGFLYQHRWVVKEMGRRGFSPDETENSIQFLIDKRILEGTDEGLLLVRAV